MYAQAGGLCVSQCEHWRIPCFPVPRETGKAPSLLSRPLLGTMQASSATNSHIIFVISRLLYTIVRTSMIFPVTT